MRQIKASEVKPGMEVQWTHAGITRKCVGSVVESALLGHGVNLRTFEGGMVHIPKDAEVTVLSEPRPEEPTEFGAKIVVGKSRFIRGDQFSDDMFPWLGDGDGERYAWAELMKLGQVTVVPDQGWTVPADAPEVPERIEEWPEDDKHLRGHKWKDRCGDVWLYWEGTWGYQTPGLAWRKPLVIPRPFDGPWTRVSDA